MSTTSLDDTIAAIATAPGTGAIGIVRLSGKDAVSIADRMFQAASGEKLEEAKSHTVHFGVVLAKSGEPIDQVLASVFRKPKTYTGENIVEFSAHGGSAVLKKILARALSSGARHAEPGEFTKRAFLNGRMDLTQAEAVLDLIRSKTDRALQAAFHQLEGKLGSEIRAIKDELMAIYAHLEADLDFPDEHLNVYSNRELAEKFETSLERMRQLIASYSKGHLVREGALVVIIGRPNVGKSSLLNAFLDRERALVSDIPGTTRDTLEESVELGGFWLRLVDTAGLSESAYELDRAAMERTKQFLGEGDLFLWVLDGHGGWTEEDKRIFDLISGKQMIAVVNKTDLPPAKNLNDLKKMVADERIARLSAKTREGMEALEAKIISWMERQGDAPDSFLLTRARHKHALESACASVEKSFEALKQKESLEFVTLDLKQALDQLKELIGEVYSEDLLDVIFKEFCIGK